MEIDYTVCPHCGSDDTYTDSDLIWEHRCTIRCCDSCNRDYKVNFSITAIGIDKGD